MGMERGIHRSWAQQDVRSLENFLNCAPDGDLRITFLQVRFWDQMSIVSKAISRVQARTDLRKPYFYLQSGMQYFYCYPMKASYCVRPEMKGYKLKQLEARYKKDLRAMIRSFKKKCAQSSVRCFVSNVDVFNTAPHYLKKVKKFNLIVADAIGKNPSLELVNNHALSSVATQEIVSGHTSHFLNSWAYQRLFSVLCADQIASSAQCKYKLKMAKNCHKVESKRGELKPRCESMIQRQCSFSTE